MVLAAHLEIATGETVPMTGLLPVDISMARPKRTLGYRRLRHSSPLPWPAELMGHEFHYSSGTSVNPLFSATDALSTALPPMGAVLGRVMGSYAHVIDVA
jgi:cobyrinic acid a,c-diamide synthase